MIQILKDLAERVKQLPVVGGGAPPAAPASTDALAAQRAAQLAAAEATQRQVKARERQILENQQQVQQLLMGIPQQAVPPSATATPASQATDPPGSQGATGKPPRAPRAGTKRAAAEPADADAPAPKAKRTKAPAAPRSRKRPAPGGDSDGAAPSAAEADDGDKLTLGGEVIDLVAETDAAVDVVERVRARTLASGAGARAWDEGFQFLSAWRLTNEALAQRREKMPGARGGSAAAAAEFVGPDVLRALQLGFAAHGAEVLRRAAAAATHRAASYAAPRRPEFAASGADARRGLGEIKRAAEKAADELAERKRQELMRAAASKRADDETRAAAQRAKAEMGVQMQADAANKALVATLGGRDAKWSKWGGGATTAGDDAKGKGKGKGKAGGAGAGTESGADGDAGGSRPRTDAGGAAGGAAPPAPAAEGSTDVQIQDLVVALQQDPLYCKSTLLYRMMNGIL